MRIAVAAELVGRDQRTIERWVDSKKLRGGRLSDPVTGKPIPRTHRWVDARHVVAYAVGAHREHLVPDEFQYLVDQIKASLEPAAA